MTVFLPSSRTLFTLLTAFSPYSSARCLAFFTDLPRNFFNWVLVGNKRQQIIIFYIWSYVEKWKESLFQQRATQEVTNPYVFCFSFPPSVSASGAWGLSSSSDCAASFLRGKNNTDQLPLQNVPFVFKWLSFKKRFFLEAWWDGQVSGFTIVFPPLAFYFVYSML